jgi:hypothetical protein
MRLSIPGDALSALSSKRSSSDLSLFLRQQQNSLCEQAPLN